MKKSLSTIALMIICLSIYSQDVVEVTDQTVKIGSEENLYFGFTEGDEITLILEEINSKELKEVEVSLYPNKTIYSNYKIDKLEKKININEKGVYQFRFKHSGMGSRVCRIQIQRKPIDSSIDFNTNVKWVEKIDTTFKVSTKNVIIGYDKKQIEKTKRVVESIDTLVETIINRTERVQASLNLNGNSSWIPFEIPQTVLEPNIIAPYRKTEVVSWAYVIATGESGEMWYKNANNRAIANDVTKGLISTGVVSSGYGALAILAIEGINLFSNPPNGENINFGFITSINGVNYTISQGNSVTAFDRVTKYLGGGYGLQLWNDNVIDAINVNVKIIAVKVITTYRDESYTEIKSVPIKEKQIIKTVKDTEVKRVPIIGIN